MTGTNVASAAVNGGGVLSWDSGTTNSVGTLSSNGTLEPTGTTTGTLDTRSLTLNGHDALDVNLAGTGACSVINVTGTATLAGTLQITSLESISPGTAFTILSSTGTITGTFAGLDDGATVTDGAGENFTINYTSNSVVLTRWVSPTITTSPTSQLVNMGQSATFRAAASSTPAPTVQWQVSTGGGSFTNISGANSTTYTFLVPSTAQSGNEYQAVFTNAVGSITTSAATLTVDSITTQPDNQTVTPTENATFTAATSNTGDAVQWLVSTHGGGSFRSLNDGGIYSGSATTTLTITGATTALNGYEYEAVFSNSNPGALTTKRRHADGVRSVHRAEHQHRQRRQRDGQRHRRQRRLDRRW